MRGSLLLGIVAACVSALSSARAQTLADPPTVALAWHFGPETEGCRRADELASALERRIGRPLAGAGTGQLVIEGTTRRGDAGFEVTIAARDGTGQVLGQRALSHAGTDCRGLDEPLELILAMIVETNADAARAQTPAAATVLAVPVAAQKPPHPTMAIGLAPRVSAGADADTNLGIAGAFTWAGLGPDLLLAIELWREVSIDAPADAAGAPTTGVDLRRIAIAAGVCPAFASGRRWRLSPCAEVQAGALAARGFGFDDNRRPLSMTLDAVAGAAFTLDVGESWAIRPFVGARFPLIRPEIGFDDAAGNRQVLYQAGWVTAVAEVGLWWRF